MAELTLEVRCDGCGSHFPPEQLTRGDAETFWCAGCVADAEAADPILAMQRAVEQSLRRLRIAETAERPDMQHFIEQAWDSSGDPVTDIAHGIQRERDAERSQHALRALGFREKSKFRTETIFGRTAFRLLTLPSDVVVEPQLPTVKPRAGGKLPRVQPVFNRKRPRLR